MPVYHVRGKLRDRDRDLSGIYGIQGSVVHLEDDRVRSGYTRVGNVRKVACRYAVECCGSELSIRDNTENSDRGIRRYSRKPCLESGAETQQVRRVVCNRGIVDVGRTDIKVKQRKAIV